MRHLNGSLRMKEKLWTKDFWAITKKAREESTRI
ncbi:MFS transporter, partial [Salmonella enterica subsp. enterica serovar Infantis]